MTDLELLADRYEAETAEAAFIRAETESFETVGDIPDEFTLIQNQDDMDFYTELLACANEGYSYIFALLNEGEVLRAFGCFGLGLDKRVYEIPVP